MSSSRDPNTIPELPISQTFCLSFLFLGRFLTTKRRQAMSDLVDKSRKKRDSSINEDNHSVIFDLFVGEGKYQLRILNTKTQNIFCCVNENLATFLYTLNRGDKKTEGEKESFLF